MRRRLWALCLVAPLTLVGCQSDETGSLTVTITLSRSGGLGPTLDRAPQSGVIIDVTSETHDPENDVTDRSGEAHFSLPPGTYVVDANPYCPERSQSATVVKGQTAQIRFDCLAP